MRTRSSIGFNAIPENVAAVVFSHLGDDPRDRVALAQVSKGWRDAEKSDASLPGGSLSALSALSYELYIDGKYEHSIYWLRKAADRGDVDAMFEMAERYLYFDGFGETLDHKKASEWYERASGCGHAHATYELAWCYLYKEGDGVEKNEAKAVELYFKAAELGSGIAAWDLGLFYEQGLCGVAVNKKEALKWWRVAVERSDTRDTHDTRNIHAHAKAHVTRIERELTMTHAD
jgi:TPR repeat protein